MRFIFIEFGFITKIYRADLGLYKVEFDLFQNQALTPIFKIKIQKYSSFKNSP